MTCVDQSATVKNDDQHASTNLLIKNGRKLKQLIYTVLVFRPKEKTIFTWIMFGLTVWSIFMSLSEIIFIGWKTIKHIYKKNVSITIYGEEITPNKKFR